jgi:hypothetical protein
MRLAIDFAVPADFQEYYKLTIVMMSEKVRVVGQALWPFWPTCVAQTRKPSSFTSFTLSHAAITYQHRTNYQRVR